MSQAKALLVEQVTQHGSDMERMNQELFRLNQEAS